MATEKRLIYLEDAIAKIVNTPTKVIDKAFFTPGMLDILADRQFEIIDMLEDIPTVDAVEVAHGRWEDMYDGKYANPRYRCSVCKQKSLFKDEKNVLDQWIQVQALTNYCPNCGAKMDGDGNG